MNRSSNHDISVNTGRTPIHHHIILILVWVITLLPFFILSPKLLLKDPAVWPDEAYFLNIAENLNTSGHVSMTLYRTEGIGNPEIRAYSYPPFYLFVLAGWVRIFGSSIITIRSLSLLLGLASLSVFFLLMYRYTRKYLVAALACLCLQFFGPFGMASRVARMDILVFFFFITTLFLYINEKRSKYAEWGAYSSATLAVLTHPFGLVVPLSLFILIVSSNFSIKKKFTKVIFLVGCLFIGVVIWGLSFSDHLDLFISQMNLQFFYKSTRDSLINLLFERDLYWRVLLFLYLTSFCTGIIVGYIKKRVVFIAYSLGTFLTLLFVIGGVDQWYFIYLPIFPILLCSILAEELLGKKSRYRYFSVLPLVLLTGYHALGSIPGTVEHIKRNENYVSFSEGVSKQIPQGKTVTISAIPDPYFVLRQRKDLTLYQVPHVTDPGKLETLLQASDILVYNFATNPQLAPYIASHTATKVTIVQEDGYQADLIFLKK